LGLERSWRVKDLHFWLVSTTLVGLDVLDMYHWYREKQYRDKETEDFSIDDDYELKVIKFSNLICASLEKKK
jgi:hypothetical protein